MRIHSDTLTYGDISAAVRSAGAYARDGYYPTYGSRSRARAYGLRLGGNSSRRPNFYDGDGSYAATWDQWGIVLGVLYSLDPHLKCDAYADASDFSYKTAGRFDDVDGMPTDLSHDHHWRFVGVAASQSCNCGAVRYW